MEKRTREEGYIHLERALEALYVATEELEIAWICGLIQVKEPMESLAVATRAVEPILLQKEKEEK